METENHPALHGASTCELGNTGTCLVVVIMYCKDAVEVESLIQSLDHVANAHVVERILVWLDQPPAET